MQLESENRLQSLRLAISQELGNLHDEEERAKRLDLESLNLDPITILAYYNTRSVMKMRKHFLKRSIDELRELQDETYGRNHGKILHMPATLPVNKDHTDGDHSIDINLSSEIQNQNGLITQHEIQPLFSSLKARLSVSGMPSSSFLHAVTDRYADFLSWGQQLKIPENLKAISIKNTMGHCNANREIGFLLPSCSKEVGENTSLIENSCPHMPFMRYVRDSMLNIPPTHRGALLLLCGSYINSQMKNTTTAPFQNFQLENAPPQPLLLTFGEAFEAFFPEITHVTKLLLCIILFVVLIFPLHPGVQIILFMLLMITTISFLPDLAHKASMTGVTCGSVNLPVFWYTILWAIGISVLFGLTTLLLFKFRWWLSSGKPRVVDDASLDNLAEALQE